IWSEPRPLVGRPYYLVMLPNCGAMSTASYTPETSNQTMKPNPALCCKLSIDTHTDFQSAGWLILCLVRRLHHHVMNDNSIIVRRFVDLVLNKDQIDSAGQFFWEDMVEQVPLPGQGPGRGGSAREILMICNGQ